MKTVLLIVAFLSLLSINSCQDKDPQIVQTQELSEEMMAYFANYEVGTQWVYQDTLDNNNFDTIELISKNHFDVISGEKNDRTLSKGYELYYQPVKSKDFKVQVTPGINATYYVKFDPMVAGVGALIFENKNNSWLPANYFDSMDITGDIYREVLVSPSSNLYYNQLSVSKTLGIVYYNRKVGGAIYGCYKLIKTIKP